MTPQLPCTSSGTLAPQQLANIIHAGTPLPEWCSALNTTPTELYHLVAAISERRQQ